MVVEVELEYLDESDADFGDLELDMCDCCRKSADCSAISITFTHDLFALIYVCSECKEKLKKLET